MSNRKIVYWNSKRIREENADINIIIGKRSNGKSYDIKHTAGIEPYIKNKERFMYLRRLKDEVDTRNVEKYLADIDINKLTNGERNTFTTWRKGIYLANFDSETFKTQKKELIGYYASLSTEQNIAGRKLS